MAFCQENADNNHSQTVLPGLSNSLVKIRSRTSTSLSSSTPDTCQKYVLPLEYVLERFLLYCQATALIPTRISAEDSHLLLRMWSDFWIQCGDLEHQCRMVGEASPSILAHSMSHQKCIAPQARVAVWFSFSKFYMSYLSRLLKVQTRYLAHNNEQASTMADIYSDRRFEICLFKRGDWQSQKEAQELLVQLGLDRISRRSLDSRWNAQWSNSWALESDFQRKTLYQWYVFYVAINL